MLPQHGVDTNKDRTFASFLLGMREGSNRETISIPLQTQFANFLGKLGIHAVFEDDEEAEEDARQNGSAPNDENRRPTSSAEALSKRVRRASFNEVEDSIHGTNVLPTLAKPLLPHRPRSQNEVFEFDSHPGGKKSTNRDVSSSGAVSLRGGLRPQLSQSSGSRDRNGSKRPVVQIREDPSIYEFEDSVASNEVSETDEDDTQNEQPVRPSTNFRDHQDDLETNARSVRFHRLADRAHNLFHDWHHRTRRKQNSQENMVEQALSFDRRVLKKQAFDQWRERHLRRGSEKQTEVFFQTLEGRANKARDLFLLTKAFTHWAQVTSDEMIRTSAARRHILRTRYFNAWQDITVVNELKVRRQGLAKFFKTWKQRNVQIAGLEDIASNFRASQLRTNSYRDWFWEFCDRRAPAWHNTRIQTRCMDHWAHQSRGLSLRSRWSEGYARLQLLRKIFVLWRSKTAVVQHEYVTADSFRRKALAYQTTEALKRGIVYADPVGRMARNRDSKLLRAILQRWLAQARNAYVARKTDELRLTRNVWTTWNDKLRCQAMSHIISDRIIVQALYKWVIAERLILFQRVARERLKQTTLKSWVRRMKGLCSDLGRSEHWVCSARDVRLKRIIVRNWSQKTESVTDDSISAIGFYRQRAVQKSLSRWKEQKEQVEKLTGWSDRANMFVFVLPAIKKWQDKLELTKKKRRREAFLIVRGRRRENLLRTTWSRLIAANEVAVSDQVAADRRYQQELLTEFLSIWHTQMDIILGQQEQALEYSDRGLLRRTWMTLVEREQNVRLAQSRAEEVFTEQSQLPAAGKALEKLSLRVYRIRGLHETAKKLKTRTEERRQRLMLRFWSDLVQQRRRTVSRPLSPGGLVANATFQDDISSQTLVEVADNNAPDAVAAATPAYLRTPLRRTTGKAKAKTAVPVATPVPAYITPFMNRIKAQYPSGLPRASQPEISRRRKPRREVEDIPERSPVTGGED